MFNNSGYSLADISAVTKNNEYNDGFMGGGFGCWWIIILFLFIFNGNGFGWGNRGAENAAVQGALTRADLCQDMNFSQMENGIRGIQNGLCDGFYAQNTNLLNGFAGVQNALTNGFSAVDAAACRLGTQTQQLINDQTMQNMQNTFGLQQAINGVSVGAMQNANALQTQISGCCCDLRSSVKDVQFQNAQDTCAITNTVQNTTRDVIENANSNTRAILDFLVKDKISTLESENQGLRLATSQYKQNAYLIDQLRPCPIPSYTVCNPYTGGYSGYGYGACGDGCRGFGIA